MAPPCGLTRSATFTVGPPMFVLKRRLAIPLFSCRHGEPPIRTRSPSHSLSSELQLPRGWGHSRHGLAQLPDMNFLALGQTGKVRGPDLNTRSPPRICPYTMRKSARMGLRVAGSTSASGERRSVGLPCPSKISWPGAAHMSPTVGSIANCGWINSLPNPHLDHLNVNGCARGRSPRVRPESACADE
jgi:hypothetical protein